MTGKQAAHVCVLICGHETKIFKVTRSESVIEHIVQAERYFWECVEKDTPPSVDASESAAKAIQQLYPAHVPLTVEDLSQNENANLMFDQLIKMKEEIQHQQERFDQLKHEIQMMMQDKERAVFAHGSVVWKKAKDSISLNTKALLQHQPELIELYPLESRAVVDLTSIPTKSYLQHQIKNSQKSLPALYPSVESKSVAISVALYLALHSLGNLFGPCSDLHT